MKINFISTLAPTHENESLSDNRAIFKCSIKVNPTIFGHCIVDLYSIDDWVMARYGSGYNCFTYEAKQLAASTTKRCKIIHKAITTTTPEWNAPLIKERLLRSDKWVTEGIVRIYEYQTAEEQNSAVTLEDNGVGFNGVDAELLSSFARQISQNGRLSAKQMPYARNKLLKYSGQLAKIANTKTQIEKRKAA